MLIEPERKIVLFTPFKNWSTSLHWYFERKRTWWKCYGPQPGGGIVGPHTNIVSPDWSDHEFWLVLRNPYDRVVSMWKFCQTQERKRYPLMSFLNGRMSQAQFAPAVMHYAHTRIIRVEDFPHALHDVGCDFGEFPHENRSDFGEYRPTDEEKNLIRILHYPDFVAGNYKPLE